MQIETDVLTVLSRCAVAGQIVTLPQQLDRKLYERVDKVLGALGGKWNRKVRGHVFEDDPAERLESALLTGRYEKLTHHGFFETPPAVATWLLTLAEPKWGMVVLEPSAGRGAIAAALRPIVGADSLTLVELRPDNARVLRDLGYPDVIARDFLSIDPTDTAVGWSPSRFDRVVMNPPFERLADVDHVRHALRFLKPGGRLVSVMSPGWTFRQERKAVDFREEVQDHEWHMLADGSFKESGTMVRAGVLVVDR